MVEQWGRLEHTPFQTRRLEEERANDLTETVSLKLNLEERQALEADKELLDIGGDGPAIKMLLEIGRKVLRDTFSERHLRYLASLKRVRYDGRKSKAKARIAPKVAQNDSSE
jgi:hypothetical protein